MQSLALQESFLSPELSLPYTRGLQKAADTCEKEEVTQRTRRERAAGSGGGVFSRVVDPNEARTGRLVVGGRGGVCMRVCREGFTARLWEGESGPTIMVRNVLLSYFPLDFLRVGVLSVGEGKGLCRVVLIRCRRTFTFFSVCKYEVDFHTHDQYIYLS